MKHLVFLLTLSVIFWNSQVFSKSWVEYPNVPDLSHMSEYDKANYWLNDRGEVDFAIYPNSPLDLVPLAQSGADVSFGHIEGGKVIANASQAAFEKFLEYGFDYEVMTPEWLTGPVQMSDHAEYLAGTGPADWYTYPSYGAYVGFLEKFEEDYPEICKMYDLGPIGVASKNHRIYAIRISDNVAVNEAEPRYLETNTIHGDEVLNLMNCLHMIDTILTSYAAGRSRFVKLVDSLEMWFVPNMNPDGTYPSGDGTVYNAQRRNLADNFDLNRNNPCPCCQNNNHRYYGLYTYWSKETEALQLLHSWYKFPFAQDQHGGTETYLWPYGGIPTRPKDEDFYIWFTDYLVEQIHDDCNNNGYMTSCGNDGVGNIYWELYECHGIRCDMNDWAGNGISLTLESSHQKLLNEGELEEKWLWCKEALLMSYEHLYKAGLHGIVTDSATGDPIFGVEVTRIGDTLTNDVNGMVLTDSCGKYVKYMNTGNHKFIFKKDPYQTKEVPNFSISSYSQRYDLNVRLWDGTTNIENLGLNKSNIKIIPLRNGIRINTGNLSKKALIGIYNISGKLVAMLPASNTVWGGRDSKGNVVSNGCYVVRIKSGNQKLSKSFILNR